MKEVSCRFFDVMLRDLRQRNISASRLIGGTRVSVATINNKDERIDWDDFLAVMHNAESLWSTEEFIELGRRSVEGRWVRFIGIIARIRFTVREFFHWVASSAGPGRQMVTCAEASARDLDDDRIVIETRLPPGMPNCPAWHQVSQGTFAGMPRMLGAPEALVELALLPDGARFTITLTERPRLWARMRRTVTTPRTLRQAADELTEAHATLLRRYEELEAAKADLARESRKLSAANRITELALRGLDVEATARAVCQVLREVTGGPFVALTLARREPVSVGERRSGAPLHLPLGSTGGDGSALTVELAEADDQDLVVSLVPTVALVVQKALDQEALAAYQHSLEERVEARTAELTRARDDLAGTVSRLEEARASREKLFHNISHEIRTPLSLVLLLVDGVLTHHRGELTGRAVDQMNAITVSTRKLVRLVDELLLLASGDERDLKVKPEPVELAALLPEYLAGWILAAADKGLTLTLVCPPSAPVLVDPDALERVLANLISNAIKFTDEGGLTVTVTPGPTTTAIAVRDSGSGIDDELRGRLFGRFEQGAAGRRLRAGSGIGLSIARELVRAHGGDLGVRNNDGGPGSTFTFALTTSTEDQVRAVTPGRLRPTDYGVGAGPDLGTVTPPGLSQGHILVAEDDPGLAAAIGQLLSDEYTVEIVSDGAAALASAQRRAPDLLVTDIEMPLLDGLELARQVQSLPGDGATPVLVMSARAKLGDRLAGFSAGAVDYVVKPFDPSEIKARVRAQLAYRALAQRVQRAEKLAAIGTLSAGLAHELRNPANGIVNAIEPLRELLPPEALAPDTGVGELLDVMQQCAEQVAFVSRQLLGFRRSGDLELRRVPIVELLTRALSNASASLTDVELRRRFEYTGPLRCASPLMTQVLVNLIENAAQAAGPGGWVELATRADERSVGIEVSDSGPGVPDHLTEKVFEPFFTTKPPGQGTGLGLPTARDLIGRHGGTLEIRSRGGRTVFVIELPNAPEVRS